ncbi:hypothetical protein AAFF_G00135730 [Aldrovandia affinis]|uniref:J domain-containing protein n=1 Tax=Aldrovandia affinis TaxID=143900 RepID=A0AAD7RQ18_9TELE|nr:hypothetical protein AAFF_G00135730 [Aldrovandia affinis]
MRQSGVSSRLSFSLQLGIVLAVLFLKVQHVGAESPGQRLDKDTSPIANYSKKCTGTYHCEPGIILPVWEPQNPSYGDKVARATVYFVALVYMFLGVSIVADRFMASIEVITSQEREITIKKSNGETTTTTVRIWNETVSNLTLMALGSSAPEILLSVIEVCGHNFEPGTLGPSTIVGSAAFNMFVIIGICVYVVPDGEHRKVKHLRVFFVTATWSIFAYIWLYLILAVISPGVVQVWEGLLTLFFFPICVLFAWVADRRLLFYKYVYKRYRAGKQRGMIIETEGDRPLPSKVDIEMDGKMLNSHAVDFLDGTLMLDLDDKDLDEEETRRDMAKILKELKQKHPDKEVEQLLELANYQVLSQQQKSRAFYRCQATRLMTGGEHPEEARGGPGAQGGEHARGVRGRGGERARLQGVLRPLLVPVPGELRHGGGDGGAARRRPHQGRVGGVPHRGRHGQRRLGLRVHRGHGGVQGGRDAEGDPRGHHRRRHLRGGRELPHPPEQRQGGGGRGRRRRGGQPRGQPRGGRGLPGPAVHRHRHHLRRRPRRHLHVRGARDARERERRRHGGEGPAHVGGARRGRRPVQDRRGHG